MDFPSSLFFIKWSTRNHTYHVQASRCLTEYSDKLPSRSNHCVQCKYCSETRFGSKDRLAGHSQLHNAHVLHCDRTALLHIVFLGWMGENFLQHYRTGQLWNSALGSVLLGLLCSIDRLDNLLRICMVLASVVVLCSCTPGKCWLFWHICADFF